MGAAVVIGGLVFLLYVAWEFGYVAAEDAQVIAERQQAQMGTYWQPSPPPQPPTRTIVVDSETGEILEEWRG